MEIDFARTYLLYLNTQKVTKTGQRNNKLRTSGILLPTKTNSHLSQGLIFSTFKAYFYDFVAIVI